MQLHLSASRGAQVHGLGKKPHPDPRAPTSGWKAWQVSGRRRSFWERILSHLTEAYVQSLPLRWTHLVMELILEILEAEFWEN